VIGKTDDQSPVPISSSSLITGHRSF